MLTDKNAKGERGLKMESKACQRVRDLTGQQFGDLIVLRRAENSPSGASRWVCRCACGEEYTVMGKQLTAGKRTRCAGKAHAKNYVYADISGQHFGMLTALYPVQKRDKRGSVIWHCRCACGQETDISYNSLVYTNVKSCGCQRKVHNEKIHSDLTHAGGTSLEMLSSKKLPANNTTGHKGVYLVRGKYMAKIVFQKKQYFLGFYNRMEDAIEARRNAEESVFEPAEEHCRKWKQLAQQDPQWAEANPVQITVQRENGTFRLLLQPRLEIEK